MLDAHPGTSLEFRYNQNVHLDDLRLFYSTDAHVFRILAHISTKTSGSSTIINIDLSRSMAGRL